MSAEFAGRLARHIKLGQTLLLESYVNDAGDPARLRSEKALEGCLEIVAAVRPLPDKQTAWWFTPRLAASTSPQPVLTSWCRRASSMISTRS